MWSRCPISATYSCRSLGSLPGSTATTLGLVKSSHLLVASTRKVPVSGKPLGWRPAAASACTAARVWRAPAKRRSAVALLKLMRSSGAARPWPEPPLPSAQLVTGRVPAIASEPQLPAGLAVIST